MHQSKLRSHEIKKEKQGFRKKMSKRKTHRSQWKLDRQAASHRMEREAKSEEKRWLKRLKQKAEDEAEWELVDVKICPSGYGIMIYRSAEFSSSVGNLCDVPF